MNLVRIKYLFKILTLRPLSFSENYINEQIPLLLSAIPEIKDLSIKLHDGYFIIFGSSQKFVDLDFRICFQIEEVCINSKLQYIKLRQVGDTDLIIKNLSGKIAIAVTSLFISLLYRVNFTEFAFTKLPNTEINDGIYTISLKELTKDFRSNTPSIIFRLLNILFINRINCRKNSLEIYTTIRLWQNRG